jgi:hypothetical protein
MRALLFFQNHEFLIGYTFNFNKRKSFETWTVNCYKQTYQKYLTIIGLGSKVPERQVYLNICVVNLTELLHSLNGAAIWREQFRHRLPIKSDFVTNIKPLFLFNFQGQSWRCNCRCVPLSPFFFINFTLTRFDFIRPSSSRYLYVISFCSIS